MTLDWILPALTRTMPLKSRDEHEVRASAKDLIVKVFASITRSNSVLTSQSPIQCTQEELAKVIIDARRNLQRLTDATLMAMAPARNASRATSVVSTRASPAPSMVGARASPALTGMSNRLVARDQADMTKRALSTRAMKDRPNMHIGIHYVEQAKEYAIPYNCNVLIGEDKHREYKKLVQRTNKRDVEKVLLVQESFKRTLVLLLEGSFADVEPRLTSKLQELQKKCPMLFDNYLRLYPECLDDNTDAQAIDRTNIQLIGDYSPNLWARQPVREKIPSLGITNARLSALPISDPFLKKLRHAYEKDWNKPHVLEPGSTPIQFFKNITVTLPGESHRTTLMDGDLIELERVSAYSFGKIIGIFVHVLRGRERAFFAVVSAREVAKDNILDLPIIQVQAGNGYDIIGLPAVRKPSLYTIPIDDRPSCPGENLVLRCGEGSTYLQRIPNGDVSATCPTLQRKSCRCQ